MTVFTSPRGRVWLALLALAVMLAAGCSDGASGNPGIDLGSGPLLAYIGGDGNLYLARGDGSGAHRVTTTPCPPTVNCYGAPSWSPDGQTVAIFGPAGGDSGNVIYLYNRLGQLAKTIVPGDPQAQGPVVWSRDSQTIFYEGRISAAPPSPGSTAGEQPPQLSVVAISVTSGQRIGTTPVPPISNAACSDIPRGGALGSLVDRAINGNDGLRFTFDVSRDATHFLVSSGACYVQVSIVARAGGAPATLNPLASGAIVQQAEFSHDGQHIVAMQTTDAADSLIVYDADGGNGHTIFTQSGQPPAFATRIGAPVWSPNDQIVYFMRGADLWQVGADGSNPHQLVAGVTTGNPLVAQADPQPSPNGQQLAWVTLSLATSDVMPVSTLMVGAADASNPLQVAEGAIWPAWS